MLPSAQRVPRSILPAQIRSRLWGTEGNSVTFIVSPHAGEIGASSDSPFEMVDVRRLQLWASRLIMM
jgi:hypothetical protein